jgi:hypothetical protein
MEKRETSIHPNAPIRLVMAFRRAKTFRATAVKLGVNVRYVYDLLVKGIEPVKPDVRKRLFLHIYRRKNKTNPVLRRAMKSVWYWEEQLRHGTRVPGVRNGACATLEVDR